MSQMAQAAPAGKTGLGRRLMVTLVVLFFLLFPMVGLLYFWNDMHAKMRNQSEKFARASLTSYFQSWDAEVLLKQADTLHEDPKLPAEDRGATLNGINIEKASQKWSSELGAFKQIDSMKPGRSWAANREEKDMVWQHVVWDVEASFEKGKARIKWGVMRPMAFDQWKVESVEVTPVSSGS